MEGPTPDRSFMKSLKSMDRKLDLKWNGSNYVVVYQRPHGEPANIHLVRTANGGFRQPDTRDLKFIRSGDLEGERLKDKLDRLSRHCEEIRRDMRKKAHDEIRAITRDNKRQLINATLKATNARKANSTFRRIAPKKSDNCVMTA